MKHQIRINRKGMIEWLTHPPFPLPVKDVTSKRWSEITPTNPFLYVLFRVIRFLFGEYGRMAGWTRRWPCHWRLTVLSTGYTETHWSREYLITKEHELFFKPKGDWLN